MVAASWAESTAVVAGGDGGGRRGRDGSAIRGSRSSTNRSRASATTATLTFAVS
jgi:hypothetical protein